MSNPSPVISELKQKYALDEDKLHSVQVPESLGVLEYERAALLCDFAIRFCFVPIVQEVMLADYPAHELGFPVVAHGRSAEDVMTRAIEARWQVSHWLNLFALRTPMLEDVERELRAYGDHALAAHQFTHWRNDPFIPHRVSRSVLEERMDDAWEAVKEAKNLRHKNRAHESEQNRGLSYNQRTVYLSQYMTGRNTWTALGMLAVVAGLAAKNETTIAAFHDIYAGQYVTFPVLGEMERTCAHFVMRAAREAVLVLPESHWDQGRPYVSAVAGAARHGALRLEA